ncbi:MULTISPECIES: response regulator transcription factor [Bacillaceae]|uniref:PhoB family transcriptional regulator n=1 Tax=Alkalicoccobacillus plakortidis TaxID=444060 RepID=A0A9D5I126_9BACI|nr:MULTISPECIES: response regulator transcription factor [Bacillaceae]KQL57197.1 PhoB family transcriptional regulator [Alkalicoccobacillus plakortidis]
MERKSHILVVEDEHRIARVLQLELTHEGYTTTVFHNGFDAWEALQSQSFDLLLLDVMLPGLSGIELVRRVRSRDDSTPIIMLTARDATVDKVTGLDLGANDYMTKPFEIEELLARIRVSLRHAHLAAKPSSSSLLTAGSLRVDTASHEVHVKGNEVSLTNREYTLLCCLLEHQHQVLSREQLLERVWGYDFYGETNIVDVYIRYLRNKIEKPFGSAFIHTVRGAGYMLKESSS